MNIAQYLSDLHEEGHSPHSYEDQMKKAIFEDQVNSPSHYNNQGKEVWEMMIDLYGKDKFVAFCELNAFKYRMRAGYKGDTLEDIEKAKWYESKMKEIGTA